VDEQKPAPARLQQLRYPHSDLLNDEWGTGRNRLSAGKTRCKRHVIMR